MKYLFLPCLLFIQQLNAQNVELLSTHLDQFQNVRDFCISQDQSEAYFTIQSPNQDLSQIVCVKNGQWGNPELLPFCDGYSYLEPFLSADGTRLYFSSNRPKDGTTQKAGDFDIWYVSRMNADSRWSAPVNAGPFVNTDEDEFYPVITSSKNLYFTKDSKSGLGKDDLYYCKWDGNQYEKPQLLQGLINTSGYEFNAYVAADESYIIFTRYNALGGFGSGDLYLSKKDKDGLWKSPENMGSVINTAFMEYCPFFDNDNQILYFTSRRNKLVPQNFETLEAYNDYISKGENGMSKIYKIKLILP
ncbi:MAG: hypothetical protein U0V54_15735 [Saprospiraceae bacterium]